MDPLVGLIVAAVILFGTWGLLRDSLTLLSHGDPRNVDYERVKQYFEKLPSVDSVHDLHFLGAPHNQQCIDHPPGGTQGRFYRFLSQADRT